MLKRLSTAAAIIALGLTLSACDKCGDWPWTRPAGAQSCKGSLPQG